MDIYGNYRDVYKIDKEFEKANSCSLFELYAIFKDKSSKKSGADQDLIPVLSKAKQYAERFNKYGFPETQDKTSAKALELRKILNPPRIHFTDFEKAQLLDLLPQRAEEAFTLIPSLKNKVESEEEMQYFLDQLQKLASSVPLDK